MSSMDSSSLWAVIIGFIVSFFLAMSIGSNDVANSFGTSVGSKVLTLKKACLLATICETSGAILLGYHVADMVRKEIMDLSLYLGSEKLLLWATVAILAGSAVWQFCATFMRMPVSASHAVMGAVLGVTIVTKGPDAVRWETIGRIAFSWIISPIAAGVCSYAIFFLVKSVILNRRQPLRSGLRSLPLMYAITVFINVFSILYEGSPLLKFDVLTWWQVLVASTGAFLLTGLLVQLIAVPRLWKTLIGPLKELKRTRKCSTLSAVSERKVNHEVVSSSNDEEDYSNARKEIVNRAISRIMNPPQRTQSEIFRPPDRSQSESIHPVIIKSGMNPTPIKSCGNFLSIETIPNKPRHSQGSQASIFSISSSEEDRKSMASVMRKLKKARLKCVSTDTTRDREDDRCPCTCHTSGNSAHIVTLTEEKEAKENKIKEMDPPHIAGLFSFLQILNASFASFAHGGNDVSNAIGPLITLWMVYQTGSATAETGAPLYLLLYGGIGISLGLWIWGGRVIETIGTDLTNITPSSGFTIEIGAAFVVILASKIGIPISSTHCKVGSVIFVGWAKSSITGVDWRIFKNIVISWLLTVPASCITSAGLMGIIKAMI